MGPPRRASQARLLSGDDIIRMSGQVLYAKYTGPGDFDVHIFGFGVFDVDSRISCSSTPLSTKVEASVFPRLFASADQFTLNSSSNRWLVHLGIVGLIRTI